MKNAWSKNDKELKAKKIADAALELFKQKSFADISMNQIAKHSEVAKGTLFNYYQTKENIFMNLLLVGYTNYFKQLNQKLSNYDELSNSEFKRLMLDETDYFIQNHSILIRLNTLRGPILEPKADLKQTIEGRRRLYQVNEKLSRTVHNMMPKITVTEAMHLFMNQSAIISGTMNMAGLDNFNQDQKIDNLNDFAINIHDSSIDIFSNYLDGLLKNKAR